MRVAITGASGLVGVPLTSALAQRGDEVLRLVRRRAGEGELFWDPERAELDPAGLEGVDAVIHLAGENVGAGRWTPERKRRILESRTRGTRLLCQTLARLSSRPSALVSASAVGYYGDAGESWVDEDSPSGVGFLAEVARSWEAETAPAGRSGIRVVLARLGVVLSREGGALQRLLVPFRMGLGGLVGSGRQYLSWIGRDDAVRALVHLVDSELSGPVNVVAPEPVTNAEFTRTLAGVLRRFSIFPLPAAVVRVVFGELGEEMLLSGQRVRAKRLLRSGFSFSHPELEPALRRELAGPS